MMSNRTAARAAGALFITATVVDVIARAALLAPILGAHDHLAAFSANQTTVQLGALLLVIGALAASGIAIALYPILRQQDHALAIGSVSFRLIEGTLYLGLVVCLLVLVAVSQESTKAGAAGGAAYEGLAVLLLAAREALGQLAVLVFGIGALMYYSVFYRARLVPRWLSAWGLLAIVSVMVSGVLVIAGVFEPLSPPQVVLALPIGVQEMVLAAWLITKGCSPVPATTPIDGLAVARGSGAPVAAR